MMGRYGLGPEGACICHKCGYEERHVTGVPCYTKKCPECGFNLTRKN